MESSIPYLDRNYLNAGTKFRDYIMRQPETGDVMGIALLNSDPTGRIWLIGGTVYRTLAHFMHKIDLPVCDWDFIVEKPIDNINLPEDWEDIGNQFGTHKFTNGKTTVDFIPLNRVSSIVRRELKPNIGNYLEGVPLTIQSIAYDIKRDIIVGGAGIYALKTRTVRILNRREAEIGAKLKKTSLDRYLIEKAQDLEFTPIFP
jgi:hypothetical protein